MEEITQAPSHRLVEFLNAISRADDVVTATHSAAELVTAVGFGRADTPTDALVAVGPGVGVADLGPLGSCDTLAAPWSGAGGSSIRVVVARVDRPFDQADRNLLMGMAGALGLVLDMLQ